MLLPRVLCSIRTLETGRTWEGTEVDLLLQNDPLCFGLYVQHQFSTADVTALPHWPLFCISVSKSKALTVAVLIFTNTPAWNHSNDLLTSKRKTTVENSLWECEGCSNVDEVLVVEFVVFSEGVHFSGDLRRSSSLHGESNVRGKNVFIAGVVQRFSWFYFGV